MRISFLVGELMMNAVRRHPEDRPPFKRKRRAPGQKVLHPLRGFVSAMGEEPVIAHPDAQAAGDPPEKCRYQESLPGKEEERGDRAQVEQAHGGCRDPVDTV